MSVDLQSKHKEKMSMKISHLFAAFALIASSANAATVTAATTGAGGDITSNSARAIYGTDGTAVDFGTGFVSVGYFGSLPDFDTTDAGTIAASFSQLGSAGTMGLRLGAFSIDGLFSLAASEAIVGGGLNADFISANIVTVIGDGTSIADSSALLVLQSSTLFGADAPSFTAGIDLQTGAGLTPLHGFDNFDGSGGVLIEGQAFVGAANSYQLEALVPEPSVALLGALGVFGLLRRRR